MAKLQSRFIDELAPGTRIVSHAFTMAGLAARPQRDGQAQASATPARATKAACTCGSCRRTCAAYGARREWMLRIEQNFQSIDVEGASRATLSGRDITWEVGGARFSGRVEGDRMAGEMFVMGVEPPVCR